MFRIYSHFPIRIFKTVAKDHFCCVYQKHTDTNRKKTLVYSSYYENDQPFMLLAIHENERNIF